jgi:thiamine pyrophosphokinase
MTVNLKGSFLPKNDECIGVVCNGELEETPSLIAKMKRCSTIIGVDGGINYCHKLQITPSLIVGDFDSVSPEILKQVSQQIGSTKLERAKDVTDLEVAIDKAKDISAHAKCIIFAGLGGRVDHTLSNIYLLLRNPGALFFESDQQLLFALTPKLGRIQIAESEYKTLCVYPFYGAAKNFVIESFGKSETYESLTKDNPARFSLADDCFLSVSEGEVIVCLDKRDILPTSIPVGSEIRADFLIQQPICHLFDLLFHQSRSNDVKLVSSNEKVVSIKPESGIQSFDVEIGQTISLLPFYGRVSQIETHGLKWELGSQTIEELDKNFVGISNVSMDREVTVKVGSGELLAIFTNVIDTEMVQSEKVKNKEV